MIRYRLFIFISSFLLFLIQPMMAKHLLPIVGGAPGIWIICMLFFQLLLLAGYGYAALTSAYLSVPQQVRLHSLLWVVAVVAYIPLTIHEPETINPSHPEMGIILTLLFSVGLPYFILATHSSLLQRWYHARFGDAPYSLFAVSNIGSLIGLFCYPLAIEWIFDLPNQMLVWSIGFIAMVLSGVSVIFPLWKGSHHEKALMSMGSNLRLKLILRVVFLGFIPSALFLATTLHITTDIASFPLLWVIPLALYLITFILAFGKKAEKFTHIAQGLHLFALCFGLAFSLLIQFTFALFFSFLFFFIIAMSCHGQAALIKPKPEQLTAYFFWLSVGGACGGLFNLAAPYLFDNVIEYYLLIALSFFALPMNFFDRYSIKTKLISCVIIVAGVAVIVMQVPRIDEPKIKTDNQVAEKSEKPRNKHLFVTRNFYGVSRVVDHPNKIEFTHGTTVHGFQPKDEAFRLNVTSYYGPLKKLMNAMPEHFFDKPFGVLGLGAGTLACIGASQQKMDFFEIDQAVIDIAQNTDYFTYLKDCGGHYQLYLGDGRLELAKQPNQRYHLLVMDAFTSDAIPFHLLTEEALLMYRAKLVPTEGIIAFNISNRHLRLEPFIAKLAESIDYDAYHLQWQDAEDDPYDVNSNWMIVAPKDSPYADDLLRLGYEKMQPDAKTQLWTDSYSNILPAIKW